MRSSRVFHKGERINDRDYHAYMVDPGGAAARPLPDKRLFTVPVIDTFLRALTEYYDKDAVAPGIVVAWLPERKVFYCSVRRYSSHTHALRSTVIAKGESSQTSERAVKYAMRRWRTAILHPRQDNLDFIMRTPTALADELDGLDSKGGWDGQDFNR